MSDYYTHDPQILLDRDLALVGHLADDTRRVGMTVSSLTGLPLRDVDRLVEHQAGMSLWELVARYGEERYRSLERRELLRALDDMPPGILVLGDGALIDEENRRLVRERTRLVRLDLDLASCYWRLRSRVGSGLWHPLVRGPLGGIEDLRPYFAARSAGFAECDHSVEWDGRSHRDVAQEILRLLAS
jgi:shikimate kinase